MSLRRNTTTEIDHCSDPDLVPWFEHQFAFLSTLTSREQQYAENARRAKMNLPPAFIFVDDDTYQMFERESEGV